MASHGPVGEHEAPPRAVKQKPELRAVLRALGYDPETHRLYQRRSPEGLLVVSGDEPVRFLSKKQFKELCRQDEFQAKYDDFLAGEKAGVWPEATAIEESA